MPDHQIIIFTGPTINSQEAESILAATYLPPAKQGDIYKAYLLYKPKVIALIDGFFSNTPSPWHKEILFVMTEGVRVYGSSSMGALRASELSDFGMIGIGEVFQAYHRKKIEDDDEVALVHGPKKLGYPNLSEAMINIRKTLEVALYEGIIEFDLYSQLLSSAKESFYAERNYGSLIKKFECNELFSEQIKRFSVWLRHNRQDQKKKRRCKIAFTNFA